MFLFSKFKFPTYFIFSRSPTAYLANPEAERALYPEGDTDKNMTLVKIVDASGKGIGSIAWVHISILDNNNNNIYIYIYISIIIILYRYNIPVTLNTRGG